MSRFFRILFSVVMLLVGLAIVVPIAAYFFFDPNHFKSEISSYISSKTGLPLEIHGKISMQVFPWVGLNVHQVDLAQPSAFGHGKMIEVSEMSLKMPLNDLLQKHLNIESLAINGLTVNAIKNKDGSSNWEYYSQQVNNKKNHESSPKEPQRSADKPQEANKLRFDLLKFTIKDVNLTLEDRATSQTIKINKLNVNGERGNRPSAYPLEGEIAVSVTDKDPALNLKMNGHFKGVVEEAKEGLLTHFKTDFSVDMPNNPANFRELKVTSVVDTNSKAITLSELELKTGEIKAKGNSKLPLDKNQPITFNLDINQVDLDALKGFAPPPAKGNAANTHSDAIVPVKQVKTTPSASQAVQGNLTIGKVRGFNLALDHVKTKVSKTASTLTLSDLTANLYQGTLAAKVVKSLQNPQAPVALNGKLTQIALTPLLKDLKQEARVSGVANVDFNITHHEVNGLNGVMKVNVANGIIEGIDVKYYLGLAQSLFKKTENKETDTKKTPFGTMQATLLFNNHVMDNNDLNITSNDFTAKGEGQVNLNSQTLAYKIQALKTYTDGKEHANAYPLAIRIKGPISHPKIEPDYDVYLKKLMEREMKGELNKQLDKHLGKLLGTPKEGEPNTQGDAPASIEDAAKKKLEDKLNKGLKKLFKKD
ncbi:MAG: AsmA family protein [Candidatus Berkiella sp.]